MGYFVVIKTKYSDEVRNSIITRMLPPNIERVLELSNCIFGMIPAEVRPLIPTEANQIIQFIIAIPAFFGWGNSTLPLALAKNQAANRIPGAEGAYHADVAGFEVFVVMVENDDHPCRSGVGISVDNRGGVCFGGFFPSKEIFHDPVVHVDIGLVEPESFDVSR